jgi:hypothetical protein
VDRVVFILAKELQWLRLEGIDRGKRALNRLKKE